MGDAGLVERWGVRGCQNSLEFGFCLLRRPARSQLEVIVLDLVEGGAWRAALLGA